MTKQQLIITLNENWKGALRAAGRRARAQTYQGETLNFEGPGQFFGQLTEKRWNLVRVTRGKGELSVREVARLVNRDVKRVHQDIGILSELGLLERTASAGVLCPFESLHIDMHLNATQPKR